MAAGTILSPIYPIERGGTGSTTAIDALTALHGMAWFDGVTLSANQKITITGNGEGARFVLFLSGNTSARQAMYVCYIYNSCVYKPALESSAYTLSSNGKVITVSVTQACVVYIMCLGNACYGRLTLGTPTAI